MFVCICNAVKEKQILAAIANGDDSVEKLQASLEVATCCGGCLPMIEDYLVQANLGNADIGQVVLTSPITPEVAIFIAQKVVTAA